MSKKVYKFNAKDRDLSDFRYIYSLVPKEHRQFDLREDCIANYSEDNPDDFAYISVITKKKYKLGTRVSAKCSFVGSGAPLIVFTDDVREGSDGTLLFGLQFECVAHEGGCNIWRIVPAPGQERPIKTMNIAFVQFPIEQDSIVDISAVIEEDSIGRRKMTVTINGVVLGCMHVDFPEEFYVGITACESRNKFYELTIVD